MPNILLILADDLGYGELGCQGNPQIPTPNIDSIARGGTRFTSGYVSAPVCSPSRAGLMTGRYQERFGHEFNPGGGTAGPMFGLPRRHKTFAERMKEAGYTTGLFGKWHLGYTPANQPPARGFDWFLGYLPACRAYPCKPGEMGQSLLGPESQQPHYTTEVFAAEAAAFIDRHRDRPWFVYLPFNAVHASPVGGRHLVPQDAGKYADRFPQIKDEQRRIFAGMLSAMDDGVGVVLAKLRERRLEERTLIFFLSDNGGPTWQTTSCNGPLRGYKGDVLEGGIREPFLIQWKGRLPAGKVDDRPIVQLDLLPTALAAAGAPVPADETDGVDLLPYLTGEKKEPPHAALCWRYGTKHAIRMGDWKLTDQGDGPKLYNLTADVGEKTDLSAQQPEKVKELQAAYAKWDEKNVAPKWGGEHGPKHKGGKPKPGKKKQARQNAALTPAASLAFQIEDDS